jgi:hypothetical protein
MKFLIQHNLVAVEKLEKTRIAVQPYPHEFVGLIPFSHEFTSDEPIVGNDYIPYGSTLMTTLALEHKWKGLCFDLENFSMRRAFVNRSDMLNTGLVLTAYEAEKYLRTVFPEQDTFIRPDLDLKHFSGQVMNRLECADWLNDAMSLPPESGSYAIDPNMLVCLSEPKNIQAEFRWFVVGGKVISGSMYRAHGQMRKERIDRDDEIAEAQSFADGWLPHVNCVMDLALVNDRLYVIEFNCINSSGFYDHDVGAIFKALWDYNEGKK